MTLKIKYRTNAIHTVLVLTILMSFFAVLSVPASASVNIQIADATAQPSSNATTQITINNMINFGVATVTTSYNPSVVQITNITTGDVGNLVSNIDNAAGTVTIAAYVSTLTGPDSPITFANVELLAVGNDGETSPLTLGITTLADADGNSIDATPMSGVFVVGTVKGDLNGDNKITPADAAIALQIAVDSRPCDAETLAAADVSGDGRVTSLDALMILQAAAGEITL